MEKQVIVKSEHEETEFPSWQMTQEPAAEKEVVQFDPIKTCIPVLRTKQESVENELEEKVAEPTNYLPICAVKVEPDSDIEIVEFKIEEEYPTALLEELWKTEATEQGEPKTEIVKKRGRPRNLVSMMEGLSSINHNTVSRHLIGNNNLNETVLYAEKVLMMGPRSVPSKKEAANMCLLCGDTFSCRMHLSVHHRLHLGKVPITCKFCGASFLSQSRLSQHIVSHTGHKAYSCNVCFKQFSQVSAMYSHIRRHSNGMDLFRCRICPETFLRSSHLSMHLMWHKGKKIFTCNICYKTFRCNSSLTGHMRRHRGEKPFTCDVCRKGFADNSDLRRHVNIHSGTRSFTCATCGNSFGHRNTLIAHLGTHSSEKLFLCDICKKSFAKKSLLTHHMKLHIGIKLHSCFVCSKSFVHRSAMTSHLKSHVKGVLYECELCHKAYKHSWSLHNHLKSHKETLGESIRYMLPNSN